jgi:hypothetical protein
MAGLGNVMADSGRGRLRASDADRERVVGTLKAAYVHGLVTKNEFDARVSQAFASRTYAELALITADIPAGLAAVPPPPRPGPAKASPPSGANLTPGERAIIGTGLLAALALVVALLAGGAVGDCWRWEGSAALSCPRSSLEPRCAARGATGTPAVTCLRSGQLTAVRELAARRHLLPRRSSSRTLASLGGAAALTPPCAIL